MAFQVVLFLTSLSFPGLYPESWVYPQLVVCPQRVVYAHDVARQRTAVGSIRTTCCVRYCTTLQCV